MLLCSYSPLHFGMGSVMPVGCAISLQTSGFPAFESSKRIRAYIRNYARIRLDFALDSERTHIFFFWEPWIQIYRCFSVAWN